MKTLLDRLDGLANNMGSAVYEDAETCGEAAAELRRLHEANQKLQQQLGEAVWNYGEKVRANQELLEALKLALEGLEKWHFDKDPRGADQYITAIREALAEESLGTEQPAQQCNPHPKAPHGFDRNASHSADRYVCECEGWDAYEAGYQAGIEKALEFDADPQPAQQQEPVAYIKTWHKNGEQHADIWQWEVGIEALKDGNHYLYTSPPASKPWVGLSTSDLDEIDAPIRERGSATIAEIYRAIEAKLREKNA